eukprot:m.985769 g.985769  ORF g.985769 m.985769 type:complete len:94 (+) comp23984_c0_seq13:2982-3263(+)
MSSCTGTNTPSMREAMAARPSPPISATITSQLKTVMGTATTKRNCVCGGRGGQHKSVLVGPSMKRVPRLQYQREKTNSDRAGIENSELCVMSR